MFEHQRIDSAHPVHGDLISRAERSLEIMHRWGFAPTVGILARDLLGGSVAPEVLRSTLMTARSLRFQDGIVCLEGHEHLLDRSGERIESHLALNGDANKVARDFVRDLVRVCSFVKCVAITGSLASGGYDSSDDIDFDLFVQPGTKYLTYLIATLVSLRYSWRYRGRSLSATHRLPFLPKLICVNVVWPEDQTDPFIRQDADMAFELLRCRPIFGVDYFRDVCKNNAWLASYFPQLYKRALVNQVWRREGPILGLLSAIVRRPPLRRTLETIGRACVWILYHIVRWSRRRNFVALERMNFLRTVKWPYEVLQD